MLLLGRSAGELRRPARTAALIEPETEDPFRRSGITAGMSVLQIGSGSGDVAMLVGRLVRPDGTVLGIERSANSVALATQRAVQTIIPASPPCVGLRPTSRSLLVAPREISQID